MNRRLIIGYGNTLRQDDALGVVVAEMLAEHLALPIASSWDDLAEADRADSPDPDLLIHTTHQLTPELLTLLESADAVLFLDASCEENGAEVHQPVKRVEVKPDGPISADLFHHMTPGALLALMELVHGRKLEAMLITGPGASFEHGEGLTKQGESVRDEMYQAAMDWLGVMGNSYRK